MSRDLFKVGIEKRNMNGNFNRITIFTSDNLLLVLLFINISFLSCGLK